MRPLKLKISAFGPYSGVTEFDFDKLGTNGLYLITGALGGEWVLLYYPGYAREAPLS